MLANIFRYCAGIFNLFESNSVIIFCKYYVIYEKYHKICYKIIDKYNICLI